MPNAYRAGETTATCGQFINNLTLTFCVPMGTIIGEHFFLLLNSLTHLHAMNKSLEITTMTQ